MGQNSFTKEEKVLFAEQVLALEDALSAAGLIRLRRMNPTDLARGGDTVWIPRPYIMTSYDGLDQSANFTGKTQLSIPLRVNRQKSVPFALDGLELRDALQERRLFDGAMEKLASDINRSVIETLSLNSSLTVTRSGAASGFDDMAACSVMLDQNGVPADKRVALVNPADYVAMSSDLSKASRSLIGDISTRALRQAFVGELAGLNTYRMQYTNQLTAAAGNAAITINTLAAGGNTYVPKSTESTGDGIQNIDSRRQRVSLSSNTNVKAGDRFSIDDVYNVHPITKQSTGELKTFVVISVVSGSGTDVVISPPLISGLDGSEAGKQYKNCEVAVAAANSDLNWLNASTRMENYFFHEDAISMSPSLIAFPEDAGWVKMTATTKNGLQVSMLKQGAIGTGKVLYRSDVRWGVNAENPEAMGVLLFNTTPTA
jgi:hypothetical protein